MKINFYNNNYQPNFRAVKVAETKNIITKTTMDIYKLGDEDIGFLRKLFSSIKIDERCKNMETSLKNKWQGVFEYAISNAKGRDKSSYVTVSNNKVCGIMTFSKGREDLFLDAICAIPDKNGNRVSFTGKTLLYKLFKIAKHRKSKSIMLEAMPDSPFNPMKKYKELGFIQDSKFSEDTSMICHNQEIEKQLKTLPSLIELNDTCSEKINLENTID